MEKEIELNKPIRHLALIMDGNGRWAKARGLPRHLGHKEACNRIVTFVEDCQDYDVEVVSIYAFSTENWKRPQDEIDHLFDYLELFFKREIKRLIKDEIRVMISGDATALPKRTQKTIKETLELTKDLKRTVLNVCLNYGGKQEIVKAAKELASEVKEGKISVDEITLESFEDHLYTRGLPNVDLLIRTSGEIRTSNFLPWQLAYAEFVFTPVQFPDFRRPQLVDCFKEYNNRHRRYGGLEK